MHYQHFRKLPQGHGRLTTSLVQEPRIFAVSQRFSGRGTSLGRSASAHPDVRITLNPGEETLTQGPESSGRFFAP